MSKYTVVATWEDAIHLSKEAREELLQSIPPSQRKARSQGIPHMGAGLVYPLDPEIIKISDFHIPLHFRCCYAFDTGWNWNACAWGAWDVDNDIVYLTSVYKRQAAEPPINAAAILGRGSWIPGVADAADVNRVDGRQYIEIYRQLGMDIELPDKAFESGVQQMWTRLSTGKLRVFASCAEWFEEFNVYSRDENGHIPERADDHLMDCSRYLIMSALRRAKVPPQKPKHRSSDHMPGDLAWMG